MMKIYLFRHAEKASLFHPNPRLSARGQEQAQRLAEKVLASEISRPTEIWASPKTRAQESFQPLADAIHLPLQSQDFLDEKQSGEDRHRFRQRIEQGFQDLSQREGVIYLCTHYDWLEEAMALIPCDADLYQETQGHWNPLQYLVLQHRQDIFEFIECKRIPL